MARKVAFVEGACAEVRECRSERARGWVVPSACSWNEMPLLVSHLTIQEASSGFWEKRKPRKLSPTQVLTPFKTSFSATVENLFSHWH